MAPKVCRVYRSTDYGSRNNCVCCIGGNHMPRMPEEKIWQRYVLPGIIIATIASAATLGYYKHHLKKESQREPKPSVLEIAK